MLAVTFLNVVSIMVHLSSAQFTSWDTSLFLRDVIQEFRISNLTVVSSSTDLMLEFSKSVLNETLQKMFVVSFVQPEQYFNSYVKLAGAFDSPTFFHDPIYEALPTKWSLGHGEVFLPYDQDLDVIPRRLDSKLYLYKYDQAETISLHESYSIAGKVNITQPIGHWSQNKVCGFCQVGHSCHDIHTIG